MKLSKRFAVAATVPAFALAGCYIMPIGPDGRPAWPPLDPTPISSSTPAQQQPAPNQPLASAVLQARLYPANEIATQTGVLNGTVTNMMSGKGRFNLNYRGEVLSGEATRTSGDARKGVASAYGSGGSFMSCEYQMSSPYQGAGECTLSNGARYQVHLGN
jgi:hypothetical protein